MHGVLLTARFPRAPNDRRSLTSEFSNQPGTFGDRAKKLKEIRNRDGLSLSRLQAVEASLNATESHLETLQSRYLFQTNGLLLIPGVSLSNRELVSQTH